MAQLKKLRTSKRDSRVGLLPVKEDNWQVRDDALQSDDVEELYLHKPWPCSDIDMMFHALRVKARECFKKILTEKKFEEWNYQELTTVFHESIVYDYPSLVVMVDYGYRDVNQRLSISNDTPLHTATNHLFCSSSSRLSKHYSQVIEFLLSMGARASATNACTVPEILELHPPLDNVINRIFDNFNFESNTDYLQELLLSAKSLIDAMKNENNEELPISLLTVLILHDNFAYLLYRTDNSSRDVHHGLDMCVKILEMLLKAGVNLRDKKLNRFSPVNPSTSQEEFFQSKTIDDLFYGNQIHDLVNRYGRDGQLGL